METIQKMKQLEKVKKRVDDLKKFYKHLFFYLIVNGIVIVRRIYLDIERGDNFFEAIFDLSNYRFFFWWGILLILHGVSVARFDFLFGKNWESRKINEQMNNYK